jgi:hypothetical protein
MNLELHESVTTSDGQALFSPSHIAYKKTVYHKVLCWFMFSTFIGKIIWKPTLENDCLVYRPFWKL